MSTTPRFIAVLDVGKTNVKVVVHDLETGEDVFVRTRPNAVIDAPPYPHYDVEGMWTFFIDTLKEASATLRVDALSFTTHGATFALMAGDRLALPILDYEFHGPDALEDAYLAARPPFTESFTPRLPGGLNAGAQLFWQARTFPKAFSTVTAIVPYPQYWAFRFTGVMASEPTSLGVHTDLWAPEKRDFSSFATAEGWSKLFAPPRSAFDRLGTVSQDIATLTGLPADTPVYCGIHDSNASLLPHLLGRQPPFTVLSTGTWVIVFAVGGEASALDARRDGLCNVDAFSNPVPSSRFMGGREFDLLTEGHPRKPTQEDVRSVLDDSIMVHPTFVPGCGPFPDGKGEWSRDPSTLAGGVRTAAVSLYLALVAQAAMSVAGAAGPIIIEGPFGRDTLFAEALQRLTGRPVAIADGATGTSTGAAMLALGSDGQLDLPPDRPVGGIYDLEGLESYAERWAS
ncbi:FGGY-family carbohydrate kinase [Pleomorphomonas sp. JP5]|uniref:FGGY-family carbohydrate kinase n=1 Tax=Pleomorphomonas sp. JP5 TaxID=2942998 RepID=UPI002043C740|nr:FGGY-family carbohydrate kinase [Pleomorphomonas sp. JP5]MCM5558808.1 FGGY-family carbohydrate kinase [Pleomorphomonas sp. JP5]